MKWSRKGKNCAGSFKEAFEFRVKPSEMELEMVVKSVTILSLASVGLRFEILVALFLHPKMTCISEE